MAGQGVKIKWSDHLNSSWIGEKPESVCHREAAEGLYARLIESKEVVPLHDTCPAPPTTRLPDFEPESGASRADHEAFVGSLLSAQLGLAAAVLADSPISGLLRQRLIVLRRIFHALATKYHDAGKSVSPSPGRRDSGRVCADGAGTGSGGGQAALVAMGVKTGLTLVFSLLRQSWAQQTGA
ncbi:probable E3 ubiquitin-protein ligase HERC1, partial [Amphibalanus amphitrite]